MRKKEESKTAIEYSKVKKAYGLQLPNEVLRCTNLFLNAMLGEISYPTFNFLADTVKEKTGKEITKLRDLDRHTHGFAKENIFSTEEERHILKAINQKNGKPLIHQFQQVMNLCRLSFPDYGKTKAQQAPREKSTAWEQLVRQRSHVKFVPAPKVEPKPIIILPPKSKPRSAKEDSYAVPANVKPHVFQKQYEPQTRDERFEGFLALAQDKPNLAATILTSAFKTVRDQNNIKILEINLGAADVRSVLAPSVTGVIPTQKQIDSLRAQMKMNDVQYNAINAIAAIVRQRGIQGVWRQQ